MTRIQEKKSQLLPSNLLTAAIVVVLGIAASKTVRNGDPLIYMVPNFLIYTPLNSYVLPIWEYLDPSSRLPPIPANVLNAHKPVRSINASDYSFEKLVDLTENFRYPVVVRGLFQNSPGLNLWNKKGYLTETIGEFDVKVAFRDEYEAKIGTRQKYTFQEAFDEMLDNEDYKGFLFFPFFSAGKDAVMKNPLNREVNRIVQQDFDLDRIWKGFGKYETHSTFIGHQFSFTRVKPTAETGTTSFDWHCEPGSNWFLQVSGTKEWFLMDPKYSSYMQVNHTGIGVRILRTSNGTKMRAVHNQLPLEYVKLEPGDLLYSPEWEWHTVRRSQGISLAVAMREFNVTNSLRLNAHYLSVIAINHFWKNIGVEKWFAKEWWLF